MGAARSFGRRVAAPWHGVDRRSVPVRFLKKEGRAMNSEAQRDILLISNSTMHGTGYLDHAEAAIRELLGNRREILFVPFALHDRLAYTERARERFARVGYRVHAATEAAARSLQLDQMDAIFVGGGNTFRLLKTLY